MKKLIFFIIIGAVFISLEIFLRLHFGFCDAVLIKEDSNFEYIAKPNQQRYRFGKHINYNMESMRSEEIDSTAVIILGFGDSVINGGNLTDQDSLATSILSDSLSTIKGQKVQFLNISAGSWGPDNCYAYLKKYGNFSAKSIYLFVSSHDAYDNMNFQKIVGINQSFPDKQYSLALFELIDRYLVPRVKKVFIKSPTESDNLGINKKNLGSVFNSGFASFFSYSKKNNIPLIIFLHAERDELKKGFYNEQGQEIIQFAKSNNIQLITDLNNGLNINEFRDKIHINEKGQRLLAMRVLAEMNDSLK